MVYNDGLSPYKGTYQLQLFPDLSLDRIEMFSWRTLYLRILLKLYLNISVALLICKSSSIIRIKLRTSKIIKDYRNKYKKNYLPDFTTKNNLNHGFQLHCFCYITTKIQKMYTKMLIIILAFSHTCICIVTIIVIIIKIIIFTILINTCRVQCVIIVHC